jgi:hypothetical protein
MSIVATRRSDVYSVPRRFGLRSILAITASYAVLFAIVRWTGYEPTVPIFYGIFVALVMAAQMIFDRSPRAASFFAGAVYLPCCFLMEPLVREHFGFSRFGQHVIMLGLAGGFLGYLAGAVIAGAYLLADMLAQLATRFGTPLAFRVRGHGCSNE